MIKSIYLKNFRSWEEVTIELVEGVNIFIGLSSQGKSNINRALDWIINNRPAGDSYRSHWTMKNEQDRGIIDSTIVRLELMDGHIVEREKSKNENVYRIKFSNNIDEFRAFGSGVPEEISKILNIQEINTQFQMDGPFLLGLRPPELIRYLNKIAHLDSIDRSFSGINKLRIQNRNDLSYTKKDLEESEKKLERFSYLKKAEEELEKIEAIFIHINRLKNDRNDLVGILEQVEENEQKIEHINRLKIDTKIKDIDEFLNNIKQIEENINRLKKEKRELEVLLINIKREEKLSREIPKMIEEIEKRLEKLIPNVCPFCNQKIKKEKNNGKG